MLVAGLAVLGIPSYYKKAGVCLSFCLSVTEKFVDLSPSAETRLRRAYFVGQTDTHGRNW